MSIYTKIIDLQKLGKAWDHVKKNKPAPGADNVTWDMFDSNLMPELKKLRMELLNQSYKPIPVRSAVISQGEKERTIALYAMRDKVLQQSIALELNRLYEPRFIDNTIAYRSSHSALSAVSLIEEAIKTEGYLYAFKVDIHGFFDHIRWDYLEEILRRVIREDEVIELIRKNAVTDYIDGDGRLLSLDPGIHMGSSISPVLSNIYLMDFDEAMSREGIFFIRYSDDMLFLAKDKEKLICLNNQIQVMLSRLGLEINDRKTILTDLSEGIEFLGQRFTLAGKQVPVKARENLNDRLETMWLSSGLSFEEKLKKGASIITGWQQYFRDAKEINSIFLYITLINSSGEKSLMTEDLTKVRKSITNIYRDICSYLSEYWRQSELFSMELFEYEQFFQVPCCQNVSDEIIQTNPHYKELLELYRRFLIREDSDLATELMQVYTDLNLYENASFWMIKDLEKGSESADANLQTEQTDIPKELAFDKTTAEKILKHLAGREDIYAVDSLGSNNKRCTESILLPLTEAELSDHLMGTKTLCTYIQRPNKTVRHIIIDVDVSRKILLKYDRSVPEFQEYLKKARDKAFEIIKLYERLGMKGYVEYSGCRGYHVWLFLSEWIPVRYAGMFCDLIERKLSSSDEIVLEFFPNKTTLKPGKYGQCIKLPFGRHIRSNEVSYFLDDDGNKISCVNAFMDSLAKYTLDALKRILAMNTEYEEHASKEIHLDPEAFGKLPVSVQTVIDNCSLMRYLCHKACTTGYLSHFERLSLLYVFGHLGDEGKEFIHTVMKKTLNYQYTVTEKFINRLPEKPISCVKLRDQYKNVTSEYGCSCSFKRSKNCYPSPVLHAISLSSDGSEEITLPTSRVLTKEKEQKVIDELNIHKKTEELTVKILELKKQRRKLDSSITKLESELCRIFDTEGIDSLEIEMGLLVRRKTSDGYEWLIEI